MLIKVIILLLLIVFPIISLAQTAKKGSVMSNYYSKDELVVNGKLLSSILVAYKEFSKKNRDLSHYEVLILESDSEVRVTFVPKTAEGEKLLGGRTSLGESISYYVSKRNNTITRWHYHK